MALRMLFASRLGSGLPCCRPLCAAAVSAPIRTVFTRSPSFLKSSLQDKVATRSATNWQSYRCPPPDDPIVEMILNGFMTLVWFWLFWRFYHDGAHLVNYGVDYIDYSTYSDSELGIKEEVED